MSEPRPPWRTPSRHGWAPADPLRRPVPFIYPKSGGGRRAALADHARAKGVEVAIQPAGLEVRIASRHPGVTRP